MANISCRWSFDTFLLRWRTHSFLGGLAFLGERVRERRAARSRPREVLLCLLLGEGDRLRGGDPDLLRGRRSFEGERRDPPGRLAGERRAGDFEVLLLFFGEGERDELEEEEDDEERDPDEDEPELEEDEDPEDRKSVV